jgi:Domain of unknown function DUF302
MPTIEVQLKIQRCLVEAVQGDRPQAHGDHRPSRYERVPQGGCRSSYRRRPENVVHGAIGSSDLMEFIRFDAGEVLRKERGGQTPKILRLVGGNPVIMKEMAKTVPDAASYAPITILVDERADGVHLSYD